MQYKRKGKNTVVEQHRLTLEDPLCGIYHSDCMSTKNKISLASQSIKNNYNNHCDKRGEPRVVLL